MTDRSSDWDRLDYEKPVDRARAVGAGIRPKTFERGRVCLVDDCETVLSIYNAGPGCSVHEIHNPKPRTRGRRRKDREN